MKLIFYARPYETMCGFKKSLTLPSVVDFMKKNEKNWFCWFEVYRQAQDHRNVNKMNEIRKKERTVHNEWTICASERLSWLMEWSVSWLHDTLFTTGFTFSKINVDSTTASINDNETLKAVSDILIRPMSGRRSINIFEFTEVFLFLFYSQICNETSIELIIYQKKKI